MSNQCIPSKHIIAGNGSAFKLLWFWLFHFQTDNDQMLQLF